MPRLTMADMPPEVQALVSGDLTAGKNQTVTIGNYLTFDAVGTNPTVVFGNDAPLEVSGSLEVDGKINAQNLPTADPRNAGDFWNDNGTVKVSAG